MAEARIHNVDLETIHFHEVGAADAIVDIVCAAVGAEALAVSSVGLLPAERRRRHRGLRARHDAGPRSGHAGIAARRAYLFRRLQKELVTPTGAAIVRCSRRASRLPPMISETVGYGAGARDLAGHSNVLRITVGETAAFGERSRRTEEQIAVLEANLDDMNPQVIGYIVDLALSRGRARRLHHARADEEEPSRHVAYRARPTAG